MSRPDAIVVGAGIVGAACAWELALAGLQVQVLERAPGTAGGATAAGMGHLIVSDGSEAQFQLSLWSQRRWDELAAQLPAAVQRDVCGCLWVAADEQEMRLVHDKAGFYSRHGVSVQVLDEANVRAAEPELRHGLAGGLLMPQESIIYAPAAATWLLDQAKLLGAEVQTGVPVLRVTDGEVVVQGGTRLSAGAVINAAGHEALELLTETPAGVSIRARKGHLAITERLLHGCRHQVAELGYFRSANNESHSSVAFNVQPRPTGQLLIGSSRQYGVADSTVEPAMLARMLRRAVTYMPSLAQLRVIRTWSGFRAATADKLPLIGPVPGKPALLLATGHEGTGITTSLATGRLIADLVCGRESELDAEAFRVNRFAEATA